MDTDLYTCGGLQACCSTLHIKDNKVESKIKTTTKQTDVLYHQLL